MILGYVELRAHSAFSFGDGVTSPEKLVERASSLGYASLALTDHADVGGLIRFTLEAGRAGIKPIGGAELEVDGFTTGFLAATEEGYRNLAYLVTRSRVGAVRDWERKGVEDEPRRTSSAPISGSRGRGGDLSRKYAVPLPPRGRPTLTWSEVAEHSNGLFCMTGPATGELGTLIRTHRKSEAAFQLDRWREVFGNRLVVEAQLHHAGGHEGALAASLIEIAERANVRWAVTNDPRYLDGAGRMVHDLMTANRADVCVNTAASWGLLLPNGEWRLKSPREMALLWKGRERGLDETRAIADECKAFDLRWLRPPMPTFAVPHGETDASYLRTLVYEGAHVRWGELDERQRAQIEHEVGVITRLGFAGFFLVMWDAVRFARSRGILCQGRGSAANSAAAYCLGITAVDPIRHGLLFERFLSEVRTDGQTEPPDIDVDFEMHRREEVLNYMYDHYSRQHAAITAVTQMYHAPTALQDMMRALGYPADVVYPISKRLHHAEPSDAAAELEAGLAADHGLAIDDPKGRALLSALKVLDDVPRLRSTHPGGFVLSSQPLGSYMPIEHTSMGRTILQFDKDDLDSAGVPKFDFLGLGGLSAIHLSFDAIEQRTGEKLELYSLPIDDAKTYDLIATGETVGTFQIESRAQIQSLLQTRPDRLYDIVVQVALIRPGPIQAKFVHPYTARRRGREEVTYTHPLLEPILRRTYGVPIFQEQAMSIAMALGGFSASEADELRRTMGHYRKLPKLHAALMRLKNACVARGVEESVAQQIVDDLHSFANYGFPESHAWSFALIAYATAWLKANYPAEFFLGMLNAWPMGFYPPATLVHDARRHGVKVLGPCMRDGEWDCTIEVDDAGVPALRVGWRHIRGMGDKTREALQVARDERKFTSIDDVVRRAKLTRQDALHLARSGAFEAFAPGRRRAAWEALRVAGDLLPLAPARVLPFRPHELVGEERIFLDYLATGICVDGHPMEHLRERLNSLGVASSRDLETWRDRTNIVVAGLVVARQHPSTSKGTVFVLLEDEFGYVNVIIPKDMMEKNREVVKYSPFLAVEGRFQREDRVLNVVGTRFRELRVGRASRERMNYRSRDFH